MTENAGPGCGAEDSALQPRFDVQPGTPQQPASVRAAGDIDLTSAAKFEAALTEAAATSGEISVDMTAVTYCDSAALHVLLMAATRHRLTLTVPEDGPITTMLRVARLDQITTVTAAQ